MSEKPGRWQRHISVILFNLGGPDHPDSVRPFLLNLFSDPLIIRVPFFMRYFIAKLIVKKREPEAQKIYAQIGGRSPIAEETDAQADALQWNLSRYYPEVSWSVHPVMRYWYPRAYTVIRKLLAIKPDRVILVPLYPQHSSTTTFSSVKEWEEVCEKMNFKCSTTQVCCYYKHPLFIKAHVDKILETLQKVPANMGYRVLFSAHGLPEKIVKSGDEYPKQVTLTAEEIIKSLEEKLQSNIDYKVCYQSRVGPLKWIGPSTEDEIKKAGEEKKALVIVPISFVSEHSETLVELDIEYRDLSEVSGVPFFVRVPALGINQDFISCLMELTTKAAFSNAWFISPTTEACKKSAYCPRCAK